MQSEALVRRCYETFNVVRDLTGKLVADEMVEHLYELQDGVIRRMEIRK